MWSQLGPDLDGRSKYVRHRREIRWTRVHVPFKLTATRTAILCVRI